MSDNLRLSSNFFWVLTGVLALADAWMMLFIIRLIRPERYRNLRQALFWTGLGFWYLIWNGFMTIFWEPVYSHFLPDWSVRLTPLWAALQASLGLFYWWFADKTIRNPVPFFGLLGGISGIVIYGIAASMFKILEVVPALGSVSLIPFLLFGFLEQIMFWLLVLLIAYIMHTLWTSLLLSPKSGQRSENETTD